jgi:ABC-type thiamine transport system ATPase subunit
MIQPITLIDEAVATLREACAGMLLTLVRHACASRQNKFKVHVLHLPLPLAYDVRKDSFICLKTFAKGNADSHLK